VNREQKAATIDALASELQGAETIIAVDYRGLSVAAAAELRTKLRRADASFRVVKNSLTERAAEQAGVSGLDTLLEGPTALTFVRGDAALAAKAIAEQARATQLLPFKGGVMGAHELDPAQLSALARLPAREVLYGQLVGVVASPIGGIVRSLNALISGLAVALGQVREQKERDAPAAEAEPAPEAPAAEAESTQQAPAPDAANETAEGEQSPADAADEATEGEPAAAASEAEPQADAQQAEAEGDGAEEEAPEAFAQPTEGATETASEPEAPEAQAEDNLPNGQEETQAEPPDAQPDGTSAEASETPEEN
jgi:large subunit ribosomal protein L10